MKAKEEKILLMAKTTNEQLDIMNAIKQVVNNCIISANIDIEKLALFDIEFLFIKLRAVSVSNKFDVFYTDNEDETEYKQQIDLDAVVVKFPEIDPSIKIENNITIKMKYPEVSLFTNKEFIEKNDKKDVIDAFIGNCIDKISGPNEIYKADSPEELNEFINNLSIPSYDKLREYILTLPTIYYEINYKNKLGKDRKIVMNTLNDFFQF